MVVGEYDVDNDCLDAEWWISGERHARSGSSLIRFRSGLSTASGDASLIATPTGNTTGIGPFTLSGGAASGTTNQLPGGTSYNVVAHYEGNGTDAPSDSSPVTVTVAAEPSKVFITVPTFNPETGQETGTTPTTLVYGSPYILRADVTNATGSLERVVQTAQLPERHDHVCRHRWRRQSRCAEQRDVLAQQQRIHRESAGAVSRRYKRHHGNVFGRCEFFGAGSGDYVHAERDASSYANYNTSVVRRYRRRWRVYERERYKQRDEWCDTWRNGHVLRWNYAPESSGNVVRRTGQRHHWRRTFRDRNTGIERTRSSFNYREVQRRRELLCIGLTGSNFNCGSVPDRDNRDYSHEHDKSWPKRAGHGRSHDNRQKSGDDRNFWNLQYQSFVPVNIIRGFQW